MINNNPRYWKDPRVYNPDRWTKGEGSEESRPKCAFFAFSGGIRSLPPISMTEPSSYFQVPATALESCWRNTRRSWCSPLSSRTSPLSSILIMSLCVPVASSSSCDFPKLLSLGYGIQYHQQAAFRSASQGSQAQNRLMNQGGSGEYHESVTAQASRS